MSILGKYQLRRSLWTEAPRDLKVSGHLGLEAWYSGNFQVAVTLFSAHPAFSLFRTSALVEQSFPKIYKMRQHIDQEANNDVWFKQPDGPLSDAERFVEKFRRFQMSKSQTDFDNLEYPGRSVREMTALAQAHLIFAYRNQEHAGRALTVAEDLAKFNGEGKILSPWFVTHALLLHGRMAMKQGNALIAEALFDAAKEKAEEAFSFQGNCGRNEVLLWRCMKHKADLLVKWEKREAQGVAILEGISGKYDLAEIADASEIFVPPPSLEDLDILLESFISK
jgi:hypothetical protein